MGPAWPEEMGGWRQQEVSSAPHPCWNGSPPCWAVSQRVSNNAAVPGCPLQCSIPGEQQGGGRNLQGDFFPTLEDTHEHVPWGGRAEGCLRGTHGSWDCPGEGHDKELIRSFSKLAAATEKVPYPGWSDAHPNVPSCSLACSSRI